MKISLDILQTIKEAVHLVLEASLFAKAVGFFIRI